MSSLVEEHQAVERNRHRDVVHERDPDVSISELEDTSLGHSISVEDDLKYGGRGLD